MVGDGAAGGADFERRTVVGKALVLGMVLGAEHGGSDDDDEEYSETVEVDDADGDVVVGDGAQSHTELVQKANEKATKTTLEWLLSWPSRDWSRRS